MILCHVYITSYIFSSEDVVERTLIQHFVWMDSLCLCEVMLSQYKLGNRAIATALLRTDEIESSVFFV